MRVGGCCNVVEMEIKLCQRSGRCRFNATQSDQQVARADLRFPPPRRGSLFRRGDDTAKVVAEGDVGGVKGRDVNRD